MVDVNEFYAKLDRDLVGKLRSTGQVENAFWQHIGKIYNYSLPTQGNLYDTIFANVSRQLAGKKPHGFQQNKKTDTEKNIEKGEELNGSR